MQSSNSNEGQSFLIDYRGFLLPVETAVEDEHLYYRITLPDTSVVQLEKNDEQFTIAGSTLPKALDFMQFKTQELGLLIEQYDRNSR